MDEDMVTARCKHTRTPGDELMVTMCFHRYSRLTCLGISRLHYSIYDFASTGHRIFEYGSSSMIQDAIRWCIPICFAHPVMEASRTCQK